MCKTFFEKASIGLFGSRWTAKDTVDTLISKVKTNMDAIASQRGTSKKNKFDSCDVLPDDIDMNAELKNNMKIPQYIRDQ